MQVPEAAGIRCGIYGLIPIILLLSPEAWFQG